MSEVGSNDLNTTGTLRQSVTRVANGCDDKGTNEIATTRAIDENECDCDRNDERETKSKNAILEEKLSSLG